MQFVVEHEFDVPCEQLEAAMLDPAYLGYLSEHHELLERVEERGRKIEGAQLVRSIHYAPKPAFEQLGPKKLSAEWFEFVDESSWDPARKRLTFTHVASEERVRKRLSTRGEVELTRVSSTRTRRTTRAQIEVRDLPFYLKPFRALAEQMLVREARKMVDHEAHTMARYLHERS